MSPSTPNRVRHFAFMDGHLRITTRSPRDSRTAGFEALGIRPSSSTAVRQVDRTRGMWRLHRFKRIASYRTFVHRGSYLFVLDRLCNAPSDAIKSIQISLKDDHESASHAISNLFQGKAPNLRRVEFCGVTTSWTSPIFNNLNTYLAYIPQSALPSFPRKRHDSTLCYPISLTSRGSSLPWRATWRYFAILSSMACSSFTKAMWPLQILFFH